MNTPWGVKQKFCAPSKSCTVQQVEVIKKVDNDYTNALRKLPYEKHILFELQLKKRDMEKMTSFLYMDRDIVLPWCKTDPYIDHVKYIEKLAYYIMKQENCIKLLTDTIVVHETDFSRLGIK
jgi:hypothetical protein